MENLNLSINYSSPYELEMMIRDQAELEWKYHKKCSEAMEKVEDLTLQLEITTGEIVNEICKEKHVPPSAKSEVRRTEVPLDARYQLIRKRLIKATGTANILQRATYSLTSRRYSLLKLAELTTKQMGDSLVVYGKKNTETLINKGAADYREENHD
jgi:hypothetical protein